VDNPFKSPSVLSFCSGLRMLDEGIEKALAQPLRIACFVEIDAFIISNLLAAMEAGVLAPSPIWANLKTFPYRYFRGKIHGIIGGYPCPPFSAAGLRLGDQDPRHLWPYLYYIVKFTSPVWCLFENVEGHLSLGYDRVKADLESLGYTVEEGIYSAEEVGAPHRRRRLFILAVENSFSQRNRRRDDEAVRGEEPEVQAQGPGDLGNTSHIGKGKRKGRGEPSRKVGGSSGIMADSGEVSRGLPEPEGRFTDNEATGCGEDVAHSNSPGFTTKRDKAQLPAQDVDVRSEEALVNPNNPRRRKHGIYVPTESQQPPFERTSGARWPARPGEPQFEWEHPRTLEPSMGCVIDGYSFREDLLSAIGNGVVAETATLATIDLIRKHGLTHLIL
jgi:site-specific DNA-cytosine methylase